jgi:hypothetical protein
MIEILKRLCVGLFAGVFFSGLSTLFCLVLILKVKNACHTGVWIGKFGRRWTRDGEGVYRYSAAGRTIHGPLSPSNGLQGSSGLSQYAFGRRLDALYDSKDPGDFILQSKFDAYRLGAPFLLGFGILCLLGGMAGFAAKRRQTGKSGSR